MAETDMQVYDPEQAHKFKFNPSEHLIQIKGRSGSSDYLEVKFRLVWFRSECPTGTIKTEMVMLDLDRETEEETYAWNSETRRSEKIIKRAPGLAIFRAIIDDGKGGHAEATKCEKAASFGDFIEKAETGSIGRALAALGYGTQFVGDELDEGHRIVDAPVEPRQSRPQQAQRAQNRQSTEAEQKAYRERRPVVEADPAPAEMPYYRTVYNTGLTEKAWTDVESFYRVASEKLGVLVNATTIKTLAKPRLEQLMAEVTGKIQLSA